MFDAMLRELLLIILGLVEANNHSHTHFFENWDIVLWSERSVFVSDVKWPRKGDEFTWNNPVQVSVLYLLKVLVLLHVESVVVIPAEHDGVHKALEAMVVRALVGTGTHCRVTIWQKLVVVWLECLPCLFSTLLKDNDHVCSH